jgi:heme-degrading monooxygenase HmoA
MGDYYCTRIWQIKPGAAFADVEALAASSVLEMQRWIPGVKRMQLLRLVGETKRYALTMVFANQESYAYWRQVEEEAPDYWERFASVLLHWEQMCHMVEEYVGELVMDAGVEHGTQADG